LNIEAIKTSILNYINHFTMYDYIAFAWLVLTFFIALLLSIILTKKSALAAVITFSFFTYPYKCWSFYLKKILR